MIWESHSVDIEQALLQADKLMEGVNDRYFINPPPGSPDDNNKDSFLLLTFLVKLSVQVAKVLSFTPTRGE
jgi:hypothetical protein